MTSGEASRFDSVPCATIQSCRNPLPGTILTEKPRRGAEEEIRRRTSEEGAIPFVEFMDLALFWPHGGYYTTPDRIGPRGDYYTSPSVHPAFGALMCVQLCQMWDLLGRPDPFHVVELGAGGGILARDVLEYADSLTSEFSKSLRYLCVDRWPRRGHEHESRLSGSTCVERIAANVLPLKGIVGCVLSNELVDALPVHRIALQDGRLWEVYVAQSGEGFREVLKEPSTPRIQERLDHLGVSLPEGYRTEVNLAMEVLTEQVTAGLERGFVLTVDYGYTAEEYYSLRRAEGTLACFYRHLPVATPYARIGRQDITAHVEFTSLMRTGEEAGLKPVALDGQRRFLLNLGLERYLRRLRDIGLSSRDVMANRLGMMELVRPNGLGSFKVLIQAKGVMEGELWGATGSIPTLDRPVPLLSSRHMPLLAGRYPQESEDWERLWPGGSSEIAG